MFESSVVKTEKGLLLAGTRITLCNIMDYLKAGWPPKLIRDRLNLSDSQISDAMNYIETHREEIETEYRLVLQQGEEVRRYWEDRNRTKFLEIAAMPPKPGQERIRAKLKLCKAKLGLP